MFKYCWEILVIISYVYFTKTFLFKIIELEFMKPDGPKYTINVTNYLLCSLFANWRNFGHSLVILYQVFLLLLPSVEVSPTQSLYQYGWRLRYLSSCGLIKFVCKIKKFQPQNYFFQPQFHFTFIVLAFRKFCSIVEFHAQTSRDTYFAIFEAISSSSYKIFLLEILHILNLSSTLSIGATTVQMNAKVTTTWNVRYYAAEISAFPPLGDRGPVNSFFYKKRAQSQQIYS